MERIGHIRRSGLGLNDEAQPLSDSNQPAKGQGTFESANAIEINAVSAAEIANQIDHPLPTNLGVPPGDLIALKHDLTLRRPTEHQRAAR